MTFRNFDRKEALLHHMAHKKSPAISAFFLCAFISAFLFSLLITGYMGFYAAVDAVLKNHYQMIFFSDEDELADEIISRYPLSIQGKIYYGNSFWEGNLLLVPAFPDPDACSLLGLQWECGGFPKTEQEIAVSHRTLAVLGYDHAVPGERIILPGTGVFLLSGIFSGTEAEFWEPVILSEEGLQNRTDSLSKSAVCFRFQKNIVWNEQFLRSKIMELKESDQYSAAQFCFSEVYLKACKTDRFVPAVLCTAGGIFISSVYFLTDCLLSSRYCRKYSRYSENGSVRKAYLKNAGVTYAGITLGVAVENFLFHRILFEKIPVADLLLPDLIIVTVFFLIRKASTHARKL